jgi:hypothetical protein
MPTTYYGACASLLDKFAILGFATLNDRLATPGAIAALTQEPSSPSLINQIAMSIVKASPYVVFWHD